MKYAVISDVHANESALRRVLADASAEGAKAVVSLGDVVGYGPLPSEAVALVRKSCALAVVGNHDDAVSGRGSDTGFVDLASDAALRHREALSPDDLAWLRSLPYTCEFGAAVAAHGDLFDPPKFYYVESESDAKTTLDATDAQIVFVGHTHVPALFVVGSSGTVYKTEPQDFTTEPGKRYVVNPGSVGYPRESGGECYSSYVLYDSDEGTIVYRRLPFSVASVMQRGRNPRRIGWRTIVTTAAAVALAATAATWLLAPKKMVSAPVEEIESADALVVDSREVGLGTGPERPHYLSPGLELRRKPKSPPVELITAYYDADGRVLATETETVKASRTSFAVIPAAAKDAAKAVFVVRRQKPGDAPCIVRFDPRAAVKRQ